MNTNPSINQVTKLGHEIRYKKFKIEYAKLHYGNYTEWSPS